MVSSAAGSEKIALLVDDHEDFCIATGLLLKTLGFRVTCARDGADALKKLETVTPSVILTDLFMPNIDGLELIRRLRKQRPEIPVIAVTGDMHVAAESVGYTAASLGARAVLMKPFSKEQLAGVIGFASSPPGNPPATQP